jgi:hypothetical protein
MIPDWAKPIRLSSNGRDSSDDSGGEVGRDDSGGLGEREGRVSSGCCRDGEEGDEDGGGRRDERGGREDDRRRGRRREMSFGILESWVWM